MCGIMGPASSGGGGCQAKEMVDGWPNTEARTLGTSLKNRLGLLQYYLVPSHKKDRGEENDKTKSIKVVYLHLPLVDWAPGGRAPADMASGTDRASAAVTVFLYTIFAIFLIT